MYSKSKWFSKYIDSNDVTTINYITPFLHWESRIWCKLLLFRRGRRLPITIRCSWARRKLHAFRCGLRLGFSWGCRPWAYCFLRRSGLIGNCGTSGLCRRAGLPAGGPTRIPTGLAAAEPASCLFCRQSTCCGPPSCSYWTSPSPTTWFPLHINTLTIDLVQLHLQNADTLADGMADIADVDTSGPLWSLLPELVGHVNIVALAGLLEERGTVSWERRE